LLLLLLLLRYSQIVTRLAEPSRAERFFAPGDSFEENGDRLSLASRTLWNSGVRIARESNARLHCGIISAMRCQARLYVNSSPGRAEPSRAEPSRAEPRVTIRFFCFFLFFSVFFCFFLFFLQGERNKTKTKHRIFKAWVIGSMTGIMGGKSITPVAPFIDIAAFVHCCGARIFYTL
jgi:hypothetical protein